MTGEQRSQEVQASPEEARFLRRFVWRTTLPWFACLGAFSGLALGVALSSPPPSGLTAPAPSAPHASEQHEDLSAEIASLREELAALRSTEPRRSPPPEDLEPRLAKLEAELAARPTETANSAPAAASQPDLVVVRDRLYELESRLYDVERSLQTAPAAPAP